MRDLTEHEVRIGQKLFQKAAQAQVAFQQAAEAWNDFQTLMTNGDEKLKVDIQNKKIVSVDTK